MMRDIGERPWGCIILIDLLAKYEINKKRQPNLEKFWDRKISNLRDRLGPGEEYLDTYQYYQNYYKRIYHI